MTQPTEVKRFGPYGTSFRILGMGEQPNGDYIKYSDYEALKRAHDILSNQIAEQDLMWKHLADKYREERDQAHNAAVEECKRAANLADIPDGYQWGEEAMEQFNFGKKCAVNAILLLKRGE